MIRKRARSRPAPSALSATDADSVPSIARISTCPSARPHPRPPRRAGRRRPSSPSTPRPSGSRRGSRRRRLSSAGPSATAMETQKCRSPCRVDRPVDRIDHDAGRRSPKARSPSSSETSRNSTPDRWSSSSLDARSAAVDRGRVAAALAGGEHGRVSSALVSPAAQAPARRSLRPRGVPVSTYGGGVGGEGLVSTRAARARSAAAAAAQTRQIARDALPVFTSRGVEEEARQELGIEVGRLLRQRLAGLGEAGRRPRSASGGR